MTYCHSLEHLVDFRDFIAEARRALRPGGLIYLEVPDARYYGEGDFFRGGQWIVPEHVNHFSAEHLVRLWGLLGCEVLAEGHLPLSAYLNQAAAYPHYAVYVIGRRTEGRFEPAKPRAARPEPGRSPVIWLLFSAPPIWIKCPGICGSAATPAR